MIGGWGDCALCDDVCEFNHDVMREFTQELEVFLALCECRLRPLWIWPSPVETRWWHFCEKIWQRPHGNICPGALQTRLDLYNSKLALASSPVLFWNLCIQSEYKFPLWSVECGLAAVVGQASKAPLSLLPWQLQAAQELYQHLFIPPPPPS